MAEMAVRTAEGAALDGDLTLPAHTRGVVLFAHGSGSSRHSPRNRAVGGALNRHGLATLLVDLLTADEEVRDARTHDLRFDIGLLADRLAGIVDRLGGAPETAGRPVGLFGASTGAAAALVAAAGRPGDIAAVVSRGGRPDLAGPALIQVTAPTLMLVGELDTAVRELNEQARTVMTAHAELRIVPGATHLFEEPGALDVVAEEAAAWFTTYL
ncbi:dienelactone hydrolase family protein [Actinoplanes sp. NPDC051411]|uniref:dienelactone hydrolase family protein n=1 Tax=Actinoplanes sp. NPDC051411 TaxID=3155522 RepID=UPI00341E8D23